MSKKLYQKLENLKSEPFLSKEPVENSKLKASRSEFIGNLTKSVNCVLIVTNNIQSYDESVCFATRLSLQFLILRTLLKSIVL